MGERIEVACPVPVGHPHVRHVNIPVFLPMQGCPHQCVFCDQKRISGQSRMPLPEEKALEIARILDGIPPGTRTEIAFFGGSFTGLAESEQLAWLRMAQCFLTSGAISGIRISTRPDRMLAEDASRLSDHGVRHVELGVQSLSREVLLASGRGHGPEIVRSAVDHIRSAGMSPGIQTMMGLPGDSRERSMATVDGVISLSPDEVRIYPVLVLEGTPLAELYRQGSYRPFMLDEAVDWCAEAIGKYDSAGIRVLRTGLAETDGLRGHVLAGPHHPAFGELVRSACMLREIRKALEGVQALPGQEITISVPAERLSQAAGHGGCNRRRLERDWPGVRFRFCGTA